MTTHFGWLLSGWPHCVFSLPVFCLRLLPRTCFFDRFLGDHLCFLEVRVLTTFLTIVRSGLHGNSSTRKHENVRFGWQNSTKKHYLALEKHKNRSGVVEAASSSLVTQMKKALKALGFQCFFRTYLLYHTFAKKHPPVSKENRRVTWHKDKSKEHLKALYDFQKTTYKNEPIQLETKLTSLEKWCQFVALKFNGFYYRTALP